MLKIWLSGLRDFASCGARASLRNSSAAARNSSLSAGSIAGVLRRKPYERVVLLFRQ